MRFENEFYTIEADAVCTREFYTRQAYKPCECTGCRNFQAAVAQMEPTFRAFLEQFGIDPAQPAEISAVYAPDAKTVFYDGWYHLCGELLRGDPWDMTSPKTRRLKENARILLPEDACLFFTPECYLLDEDFPKPAIQMEVNFCLPWVLEEPNDYFDEN